MAVATLVPAGDPRSLATPLMERNACDTALPARLACPTTWSYWLTASAELLLPPKETATGDIIPLRYTNARVAVSPAVCDHPTTTP